MKLTTGTWLGGVLTFSLMIGCDSGGAAPVADSGVIDVGNVADNPSATDVPTALDVPTAVDASVTMDSGACQLSSVTSGVRSMTTRQYGMSGNLGGIDVAVMPCDISVATTMNNSMSVRARYLLGRPYWFRYSGAGFVSGNTDEFSVTGDGLGFEPRSNVEMIPTATVTTPFPGFDPTKGHLLINTQGEGTTCSPPATGVTVSVVGHPEARVIYWRGSTPTPSATSAERFGRISVENLTPGEPVTLVTQGGTCVFSTPLAASHSGRYPVVANTVTFVTVRTVAAPAVTDAGLTDAGPSDARTDGSTCVGATVAAGGAPLVVWPPIARPLGGVGVAWIGCGDPLTTTTDAMGLWSLAVPTSMPGYFRNTRAGAYPTLSGELSVPTAVPVPIYLWESAATDAMSGAWLPGYDPARAHLFIDINDTLGTCLKSGFVPTLPGHPEAVVRYVGGLAGVTSGLTATNSYGRMILTGITPGGYASPTATNGPCRLNFTRILQTGRVSLEAGSVTVLNARAEP